MPSYDEKLDAILSLLQSVAARVDVIEEKFSGGVLAPEPQPTGGLYWYKRPAAGVPRYGYGIRLGPDGMTPEELRLRALYAVKWNGEIARSGPYEDEVWAEIGALQGGDPGLIARYKDLDPDFAGFALLTGLLDCVKYDGFNGAQKRAGLVGVTVQSWAEEQANVMRGGAAPGTFGE